MPNGQSPLLIGQAQAQQAVAATPWIQTPGFLEDRARRIQDGLMQLNAIFTELAKQKRFATDTAKWREWKALLGRWETWYGQTGLVNTWLWSATDATLEEYEKAIASWTRWARTTFPEATPQLPTPPPTYDPYGRPREGIPIWLVALLVAGGAYAAVKLLK